jgi:hypothetical protein
MYKFIPIAVIAFILTGALLCSCDSKITDNPCDTCNNPCDTCIPCDTCDTTVPCDTCDTTKPTPNPDSLAHAFTWQEFSISGETKLTGCRVFSDKKIYALGRSLYEYNGSTWDLLPLRASGNPLSGGLADFRLFCLGPSDFWLVYGALVFHINDDIYGTRYEPPTDGFINACWGTSSNDMFFVCNYGAVTHFDGTTWTKMPRVTSDHLTSVWGTGHNDVWASGFDQSTARSVLIHFDGTAWSNQDLSEIGDIRPFGHALEEVWAVNNGSQKVVVVGGSLLHRKTGNGEWKSDSGLIKNRLTDGSFIGLFNIRGNSINDFFAAGDGGFVSHWNGKTWFRYDNLYAPGCGSCITNALSVKGNVVAVAGSKGSSWVAIGKRKP